MWGFFLLTVPIHVLANCGSCTYNALVYDGQVSQDVFGKPCDRWNFSSPLQLIAPEHNYCRLFANAGPTPLCYVDQYKTLSYCDVGSFSCSLCENPPALPPPPLRLSTPCGLAPTPRSDPRIVNGVQVDNYEFPFYAQFNINWGNSISRCGGSLVHPNYVLTAAHCFKGGKSGSVWLGARTIMPGSAPSPCLEKHTFSSSLVYCHPGYDEDTKANDWCLVRLTTPSKYTPIRLYESPGTMNYLGEDLEAEALMVTVAGTGAQNENGALNGRFYKTFIPLMNSEQCAIFDIWKSDVMVCGGYALGGTAPCYGDSGSAVFTHRKGEYWQIGVVSFGSGCAEPGIPTVFSRINSDVFRAWVCGTLSPTVSPTPRPTTRSPTSKSPTTSRPTKSPTHTPTKRPSKSPTTKSPTPFPTQPTKKPTKSPTQTPTRKPTKYPTTKSPTQTPTTREPSFGRPTKQPTERPTKRPTKSPTTRSPTPHPTKKPTKSPTPKPTRRPTTSPTTRTPTKRPTTRKPTPRPVPLCSYLFPY